MPPKTQKQKEEEAARLAEEQRLKEEEEERQRKEQEKYKIIELDRTKLPLPITKYYIETVYPHSDPFKATIEYLKKLAEINNCKDQLRDIDLQITADVLINDLVFAKAMQGLSDDGVQVLINILFLIFTNNLNKFSEQLRYRPTLNQKTKATDNQLFDDLLKLHAENGYFRSIHILPIKEHFKIFLNQIDLIVLAFKSDQRPLELHIDLQLDLPLQQPSLEDAMIYRPQEQKKNDEDGQIQTITQEDQEVPPEPTDEELLDPIIMEAIEKKLEQAQQELEEKLVARSQEMEQKLQNLVVKKK